MHFATHVRTWHVAHISASWHSFMLAITSLTRSINLSRVPTYSSQLRLHTNSHVSYSGAVRREWRTILGTKVQTPVVWKSSTSETVRNRTHAFLHFFAQNDQYYDLPEYWHFFLLWFCTACWSQDMTKYLAFLSLSSKPISLLTNNKASVFFFIVCMLATYTLRSSL